MESILRKGRVFDFLFGMFSFDNEEIDKAILNYDYVNMELIFFGTRVYLNLDLVSQETKIPCRGGDILALGKPPNYIRTICPIKFLGKLYMFLGMV